MIMLYLMAFLAGVLPTVANVTLVPSSRFDLTVRPTFQQIKALTTLKLAMESTLTEAIAVLPEETSVPDTANIVLMGHMFHQSEKGEVALPATTITFAVLGATFGNSTQGPSFLNALVLDTFGTVIFNHHFLDLLHDSDDEALRSVLHATIEPLDTNIRLTDSPPPTPTRSTLTRAEICLVTISIFIFIALILVVVQIRMESRQSSTLPGETQGAFPSVQHQKQRKSAKDDNVDDDSDTHLQFEPSIEQAAAVNQQVDTKKIQTAQYSSPTATPRKNNLTTERGSPKTPRKKNLATERGSPNDVMAVPPPCAGEAVDYSSEHSGLSEQFSSNWFGSSHSSISGDSSQDVFRVGVPSNELMMTGDIEEVSVTSSAAREGWAKFIRVIPSKTRRNEDLSEESSGYTTPTDPEVSPTFSRGQCLI